MTYDFNVVILKHMFKKKLVIPDELHAKLEKAAAIARCASWEELAQQILETEVARIMQNSNTNELSKEEVQAIENQLRGLGYLE